MSFFTEAIRIASKFDAITPAWGCYNALQADRYSLTITYSPVAIGPLYRAMVTAGFDLRNDWSMNDDTSVYITIAKCEYEAFVAFCNRHGIGFE